VHKTISKINRFDFGKMRLLALKAGCIAF